MFRTLSALPRPKSRLVTAPGGGNAGNAGGGLGIAGVGLGTEGDANSGVEGKPVTRSGRQQARRPAIGGRGVVPRRRIDGVGMISV